MDPTHQYPARSEKIPTAAYKRAVGDLFLYYGLCLDELSFIIPLADQVQQTQSSNKCYRVYEDSS